MISLTYVSRLALMPDEVDAAIRDIQAVSLARNSSLDIAGLLIASRTHFAQLLEGPEASIDTVMLSILADRRHSEVKLIERRSIERRLCPTWRMARFDHENFGKVHVEPILRAAHAGSSEREVIGLKRLIAAMAAGQRERPRYVTGVQ